MSSMTFGQKVFNPTPPDKGSFPLDRDGVCKNFMVNYMVCLNKNKNSNEACRAQAKDYFECRMNQGLMAKEDWAELGYSAEEKSKDDTGTGQKQ